MTRKASLGTGAQEGEDDSAVASAESSAEPAAFAPRPVAYRCHGEALLRRGGSRYDPGLALAVRREPIGGPAVRAQTGVVY
jgi:hypothetical protein